jgi:hypothetical protein
MNLENMALIDLCALGITQSIRIDQINDRITDIQNELRILTSEKNLLSFAKVASNNELIRRKCHDVGGALTLIHTNEIEPTSVDVYDRERNKVRK